VSKAIGVQLAKLAAKIMVGKTLAELGFTEPVIPTHYSAKEAVFPFVKFPGIDTVLGPEMKSTGEVMGIDADLGMAYAKSQMAAFNPLPLQGMVFISVGDRHKDNALPIARDLVELGYQLCATGGTWQRITDDGLPCKRVFKLAEQKRPTVVDMMKNGEIAFVVNTPSGHEARKDEVKIRSTAISCKVSYVTNLAAARASVWAMRSLKERELTVKALQDYHR